MPLFALDPLWNDIYTAGGFWIGVLGTVVGVAGFWIAFVQIRQTKRAAEAAEQAAKRTLNESRASYERFVGAYASRLSAELQDAENAKNWDHAKVRAQDLAELFATLRDQSGELREIVAGLRVFMQTFADKAAKRPNTVIDRVEFRVLLSRVHGRLDPLRAPTFQDATDHEHRTDRPDRGVPGGRPGTAGEDQGGGGELGEGEQRG